MTVPAYVLAARDAHDLALAGFSRREVFTVLAALYPATPIWQSVETAIAATERTVPCLAPCSS